MYRRRPHRVRKHRAPAPVQDRILELRTKYPRWGKDKLVVLLKKEGIRLFIIPSRTSVTNVVDETKDLTFDQDRPYPQAEKEQGGGGKAVLLWGLILFIFQFPRLPIHIGHSPLIG